MRERTCRENARRQTAADEVFRSPAVFEQAENRLHTIEAVLVATLA